MKYYEKLPRKATGHKCQVLTDQGERCNKPCAFEVSAHLENEIYSDGVDWISFYVCEECYQTHAGLWNKDKPLTS